MRLFDNLNQYVVDHNIYSIHKELSDIHLSVIKSNSFYYENIQVKKFIYNLHVNNLLLTLLPEYVEAYILDPNLDKSKNETNFRLNSVLISLLDKQNNIPLSSISKVLDKFPSSFKGNNIWHNSKIFETPLKLLVKKYNSLQFAHDYDLFNMLDKEEKIGSFAGYVLFLNKETCPEKHYYLQALYQQNPTYFITYLFSIGTNDYMSVAEKTGELLRAQKEFISFYQFMSPAIQKDIVINIKSISNYYSSKLEKNAAISLPQISGFLNHTYKEMLANSLSMIAKIEALELIPTIEEIHKQDEEELNKTKSKIQEKFK